MENWSWVPYALAPFLAVGFGAVFYVAGTVALWHFVEWLDRYAEAH